MAVPQHQVLGQVQNQQIVPYPTWTGEPLFSDVPDKEGKYKLHKVMQKAHGIPRGGSSIGANLEGNDPGAGGGGNATVQAQHDDRDLASFHFMLSTVDPGSTLYQAVSNAPFVNGKHIFDYFNVENNVVYLRPLDSEAHAHINSVYLWTYQTLPPEKQNKDLCLHFKALLTGHNPFVHPNMNIAPNMLIVTYCNGLHSEAKVIALELKDDLAFARQKNCCFPNVHLARHPQAGIAHPNAGP